MKIEFIESRLHEIEQRLLAEMGRAEIEARELGGPEYQNRSDTSETKEAVFDQTTAAWKQYTLVREAIARLHNGTYGICADCGRPIEPRRIESVPWTAYCLHHQEQHDREPVL